MSPGKLASQAGHAYLNSYLKAQIDDPETASLYQADGIGTKICLRAKNLNQILQTYDLVKEAGIPCDLITDSGHVMLPHFTGEPIVTALGIGPARRDQIHHITKRLKLEK